jgi:glycosyltransferase involved in cell wall biosynthesis
MAKKTSLKTIKTATPKKVLSVVIPVWNEQATLPAIIQKIFSAPLPLVFELEIIAVDDCSTDRSLEILRSFGDKIKLLTHSENLGKGSAIKTGFLASAGDVVVIQDADLEYDPADWVRMLPPIIQGKADVVFGSRLVTDQPHRVLYFWHYLGNKTLTTFSNVMTNLNLTDMETCYKMFSRKVVDSIKHNLISSRFGIEPELTARVKRFRVFEVGISYYGRTYSEGKKIGWKDGVAAFWHIFRFNLPNR